MIPHPTLLGAIEPAGGAALDQVAIATGGASVATALLFALVLGHRTGRWTALGRMSAFASRVSGLPGWAALPSGIAGAALQVALLGMYWDIALHIDEGRDAGPLANPAHYLILVGLFGVFAAGVIAMGLPAKDERPGRAAVRLTNGWHAPVGGVLIAACGAFALIGFPLDDVWHRLFGQDVTLWGPTHLMLIGGAGLTLIGQAVLLAEGMRAARRAKAERGAPATSSLDAKRGATVVTLFRRTALMGGFLIGLSTFQAEFDFGVPQYRSVFHPFLIALAAGFALVAARVWAGRGAALGAAAFFLVMRGAVALIVGPVIGQTTPLLPLYLAEALLIELVALRLSRQPLALAAVGGTLVGTVGFAAEYGWSHVAMPLPWSPDILAEGLLMALAGGLSGAFAGALLASGLRGNLPRPGIARPVTAAAGALAALAVANGLWVQNPTNARVAVALGSDGNAQVRTDAVDGDPAWLTLTAWQGGGLHVDRLERTGPNTWRTTEPIPLTGDWKALLRLQDGRALVSAPVRLPADPAIPAREVPAAASFTRPLVEDARNLQRERDFDVPGWLWTAACLTVLAIALALMAALSLGVGRFARRHDGDAQAPRRPAAPDRERPRTLVAS